MSALRTLLLVLFALALALPARADDVRPFSFRPDIELPLLGVGAGLWLATEVLKPHIAPRACRVCRDNDLDRGAADRLVWSERHERAHGLSDWLLFGAVPFVTIGSMLSLSIEHRRARTTLVDLVTVTEALVLTANLTQLVKYTAGRARPYVRKQRDESRDFIAGPDDHLSFFSGHTSSTFALAVAAGSTATLRGYRFAPLVWSLGVPLAALTGYLRIAADRHYLTDVVAGAMVGSAVGFLVPYLHARGGERGQASVGIMPPATLTLGWTR